MAKSVFSPVLDLSRERVTEAAYQMLLLFPRRSLLGDTSLSQLLDSLSHVSGAPITSTLKIGIEKSIANIEAKERQALQDIDDKRIARYVNELTGLVSDLASNFASSFDENNPRYAESESADAEVKGKSPNAQKSPTHETLVAGSIAMSR